MLDNSAEMQIFYCESEIPADPANMQTLVALAELGHVLNKFPAHAQKWIMAV